MKKISIESVAKLLTTLIIKPPTNNKAERNKTQIEENTSCRKRILPESIENKPKIKTSTPKQMDNYNPNQQYNTVPVPLKTTLFKNAQFFYRKLPSKNIEPNASHSTLLIKLDTLNLGKLWITIKVTNEKLIITFLNEHKENIEYLKESLPVLSKQLSETDYKNISLKCQVCEEAWLNNNVKNFQDNYISFINFQI